MSELETIFLTSGLTIFGSVLVFVISQAIFHFIILPKQKYKQVISDIDTQLRFYANVITNPHLSDPSNEIERSHYLECHKTLRRLSCELESSYRNLFCHEEEEKKKVIEAVKSLTRLSNSLIRGEAMQNNTELEKIRQLLNIPSLSA